MGVDWRQQGRDAQRQLAFGGGENDASHAGLRKNLGSLISTSDIRRQPTPKHPAQRKVATALNHRCKASPNKLSSTELCAK
jgi:hypothetical protein